MQIVCEVREGSHFDPVEHSDWYIYKTTDLCIFLLNFILHGPSPGYFLQACHGSRISVSWKLHNECYMVYKWRLSTSKFYRARWRSDIAPDLIQRVPGLNLRRLTIYPGWIFHRVPQSLGSNNGIVPWHKPQVPLSKSLHIHHWWSYAHLIWGRIKSGAETTSF